MVGGYKYFEAQDPGEKVVLTVRKHWLYLARPFLAGAGLLILDVAIYYALSLPSELLVFEQRELLARVLAGGLALYIILFSYISWLIRYLNIFLVTNERLVNISQLALFVRKISVLEYSSVEDVAVTQKGILATILNYGHVLVQTAAEQLNFNVQYVPRPEAFQDKVMELRDQFVIEESEYEEKLPKS